MKSSAAVALDNHAGQAQLIELPELVSGATGGGALFGASSVLLDSVNVNLSVVLGQASTTLGELLKLSEGSVLKVDRQVDCPVDVVVNGNIVARGQLCVVDDNFGVRVTEIALGNEA